MAMVAASGPLAGLFSFSGVHKAAESRAKGKSSAK